MWINFPVPASGRYVYSTLPRPIGWVIVLAVDLPFIKKEDLKSLLAARDASTDAVVATSNERIQPLAGCYRKPSRANDLTSPQETSASRYTVAGGADSQEDCTRRKGAGECEHSAWRYLRAIGYVFSGLLFRPSPEQPGVLINVGNFRRRYVQVFGCIRINGLFYEP